MKQEEEDLMKSSLDEIKKLKDRLNDVCAISKLNVDFSKFNSEFVEIKSKHLQTSLLKQRNWYS